MKKIFSIVIISFIFLYAVPKLALSCACVSRGERLQWEIEEQNLPTIIKKSLKEFINLYI